MANYPCPVCGASHKTPPEKCRLCGQLMGEDAVVGDFEGSRQAAPKKKGVGGIAVLVAVIVALVVLAAVLIGFLPGREEITSVAKNVPGLASSTKAGWYTLQDEEGGFSVEMPSESPERETRTADTPSGPSEQVVWSAWIGTDSLIEVAYIDDALPPGTTEFDALTANMETWKLGFASSNTATVEKVTETTYRGGSQYEHPAVFFEARNTKLEEQPGKDFHQRTLAFYNDGTLYTLTEFATNAKSDAFDQVKATFKLLEPAPAVRGTETVGSTVAP